ncbi:RRXRR domain-containing protein [Candidatus Borrarchaeum sp.]|uniref:RRXRR domain-containing protein n=1 Tax=Candidatus Borrarchaeum sp. TaxID=2846742 RepID=UPI00257B3CB2|nr:RRXRR domain-containing protein [Candidatus Borrarchaeum sp.]
MVIPTQELTRLSSARTTCIGLQEWLDASLVQPTSEESLNSTSTTNRLRPIYLVEGKHDSDRETAIGRVPVISKNGTPLMPCTSSKARKLLAQNKATKKRNKLGLFYIQLHFDPKLPVTQPLAIGVDPGTKFEGFSVVGNVETVVNIMSEAVTWVKKKVAQRRNARRTRRKRKTRRRKCKKNRLKNQTRIPPSTKARWDAKLRIITQLCTIIPIKYAVVEDIKAVTKNYQKRWNTNFSPLEVGKLYFYTELQKLKLTVILAQGNETKKLRELLGLKKKKSKSKPIFETHCIDAWVIAAAITGTQYPTTKSLYYVTPLQFHRRQLHRYNCSQGGIRKRYGGTISLGLKRGTLVKHSNYGLCYIGGYTHNKRLSLHSAETGKRLTQNGKKEECTILTRISFRTQFLSPVNRE